MEPTLKEALFTQQRDGHWIFAGRLDSGGVIESWLCIRPNGGGKTLHTFPTDASRASGEKLIIEISAPTADSIYAVVAGDKWPEPFTGKLCEIAAVEPEDGEQILAALVNGRGTIERDGDEASKPDYLELREACRQIEKHGGWLAFEELNDDGIAYSTAYISGNPLRLSIFRFDGVESDILELEGVKCTRAGKLFASLKKDGRNLTRITRVGTWRKPSPQEVTEEYETICRVL